MIPSDLEAYLLVCNYISLYVGDLLPCSDIRFDSYPLAGTSMFVH